MISAEDMISAWGLVELVATGCTEDVYDEPVNDSYHLQFPAKVLGISGLLQVSFRLTGGGGVPTTVSFMGLVEASESDGSVVLTKEIHLQTVSQGGPTAVLPNVWAQRVANATQKKLVN